MSPGTWPGGAWVPGGPRPGFSLLLLFHDPNFAFRNFHQDVSRFTVQKGLRPNSRIMYRFFTSHQPMMNEQDQVTWTNWPASKKKPVVADLEAMFQLAVPDLGPLWNPTEMSDHRACLDLLTRVCPDCTLRWDVPTADDVARMPTNVDSTIVGEEVNPTTLHLLAHICAALDSVQSGCNGYRRQTHSAQQVQPGITRGDSCSLPACVPLESTTQAQWRCDTLL